MARLDKSRMKCNAPRKSPKAKKKLVVKACSGGKEHIIHLGEKGYGHNYSKHAIKSFRTKPKCTQTQDK